jgi:hypothetical protein
MRTVNRTITRSSICAGGVGLALLLLVAANGAGAGSRTIEELRFNDPVAIPGVVLPAGTYVFEAIRPDIVRVSSRLGRRVLYTGFTRQVPRLDGGDVPHISFHEAPRGEPAPIAVWYPSGAPQGHEFVHRR